MGQYSSHFFPFSHDISFTSHLEPVQLRGKFLIPKVICLYLLGLLLPLPSDFEFSSGAASCR